MKYPLCDRTLKLIYTILIILILFIWWYAENCLDDRTYIPTRVECKNDV